MKLTPTGLLLARERQLTKLPPGFGMGASADPHRTTPGQLITDSSDSHLLAICPTGGGKGRNVMMNLLLSAPPTAMLTFDLKGEATAVTARYRQQTGNEVYVVDPYNVMGSEFYRHHGIVPATIDPISVQLEHSDDRCDDTLSAVDLMCPTDSGFLSDPFWEAGGKTVICGVVGLEWELPLITGQPRPDDGIIGRVYRRMTEGDFDYEIACQLDTIGGKLSRPVYGQLSSYLAHEPTKTRPSVLSTGVALMRTFSSPRMHRATARTTIPIDRFQNGGPINIFLVVPPDRLHSHSAYVALIIGTLLNVITRRRSRQRHPTLFLVDEVAALGPLPQLKQAITLLRGYGCRIALFVQSVSQLKSLWPRDWETVTENCGTLLNFSNNSVAAARQVADLLGDISAEALFQMGRDELAIHQAGQATRIAKRLDYLTDPLFTGRFDPNPYHQRSKQQEPGDELQR